MMGGRSSSSSRAYGSPPGAGQLQQQQYDASGSGSSSDSSAGVYLGWGLLEWPRCQWWSPGGYSNYLSNVGALS